MNKYFKALSNPTRLAVIEMLMETPEMNVTQLNDKLGSLSQPALSQALARLKQADILKARRAGKQIFYSIKSPTVAAIIRLANVNTSTH